jgi:putative ABC transport system substrate-binding protein
MRLRFCKKGLSDTGNVEGQNVIVEYNWLDGHYDRAPTLVGDMVSRRVAVIATLATPLALAAKVATDTVPIVFMVRG